VYLEPPCALNACTACLRLLEEERGRRAAAHLLTRDEARRIAANIAKLPGRSYQPPSLARRGASYDGSPT